MLTIVLRISVNMHEAGCRLLHDYTRDTICVNEKRDMLLSLKQASYSKLKQD
jgi:hypothetical protein